jgi:dihydrofolate reductase
VALIAAVARNGVIGIDNRLPWRLPDDMKRFRALTMGHSVIMGRKTFESIGAPLSGRQNIVVTHRPDFRATGCEIARSLPDAISRATLPEPVFVIGGEALYRAALTLADLLYLTEIDRDFGGDARFPEFERAAWREISRELKRLDEPGGFAYTFTAYERVRD